jgi:2-iminobutanoate/2-iminopropanoate deaminase
MEVTQRYYERCEGMTRKSVVSDQLPATLGPYSHAIVAGDFVLCSGTARIDPGYGTVRDSTEAQTEQAL